jgi:hypothetical protein
MSIGWICLFAAGALFAGTTAVYLWNHVHMAYSIVGAILWLADVYFYAVCITLPRQSNPCIHDGLITIYSVHRLVIQEYYRVVILYES